MTDRPADEVRLEELANKALPGPWKWRDFHNLERRGSQHGISIAGISEADRAYLEAADPTSILTLLSRLTALRAERDEYRQAAQVEAQRVNELTAERDAANARAEELRHALDNCRRVAGRKTKELPIPLSAMNNTESAIADIACELAGNLLSISEWANRALGGASAYAPRAQARKL